MYNNRWNWIQKRYIGNSSEKLLVKFEKNYYKQCHILFLQYLYPEKKIDQCI